MQEHYAVERLLVRQRKYCDAAAVAKAAEACAAREARGAALAKEARAQGSLVRRQWLVRIRMALEQRAPAAHQANIPEETTDISTTLRYAFQNSCAEYFLVKWLFCTESAPASRGYMHRTCRCMRQIDLSTRSLHVDALCLSGSSYE